MSTPRSRIPNSICTCQNPTQLPTSCRKETKPCRDHLSLLGPLPSLGTNTVTYSVGQVAFCPNLQPHLWPSSSPLIGKGGAVPGVG